MPDHGVAPTAGEIFDDLNVKAGLTLPIFSLLALVTSLLGVKSQALSTQADNTPLHPRLSLLIAWKRPDLTDCLYCDGGDLI